MTTPHVYVLADKINLNQAEMETKAGYSTDDRFVFEKTDHFAWMNLLKREVHNPKNNPQAFIQSVNRKDCMSV